MQALRSIDPGWGIAAVRVMAAVILIVAGWTKIAPGLEGFTGFVARLGFPAPEVLAPFVAGLEFLGGILLLVGLGARVLGLLFLIEFLVTTFVIKLPGQGWDASRIDLMLLAAGLLFLLSGAGKLSVDDWLGRRRAEPQAETART